jgi:hypothetical protein
MATTVTARRSIVNTRDRRVKRFLVYITVRFDDQMVECRTHNPLSINIKALRLHHGATEDLAARQDCDICCHT